MSVGWAEVLVLVLVLVEEVLVDKSRGECRLGSGIGPSCIISPHNGGQMNLGESNVNSSIVPTLYSKAAP